MILDDINFLRQYHLPMTEQILSFLKKNNPLDFTVKEIEIQGRDLFVRPSEYLTKAPSELRFETHRIYADVQYVVQGVEMMQLAKNNLSSLTDYDTTGDCQFFQASGVVSDIVVSQGQFIVFFPGEAHRPCCYYDGNPASVKKLVFKIRMK
ncbi:MAG: YhcH/YjgK/YiaL family protein [Candidatus Omnitrophica bacterium]|nr:YhcH/YjgK/YiaL family protein [Candidatus Omnitrophota bacterium]